MEIKSPVRKQGTVNGNSVTITVPDGEMWRVGVFCFIGNTSASATVDIDIGSTTICSGATNSTAFNSYYNNTITANVNSDYGFLNMLSNYASDGTNFSELNGKGDILLDEKETITITEGTSSNNFSYFINGIAFEKGV